MAQTRRDFLKTAGATGIVIAGSDLIADLLAQTPPGRVLDSKFKGLSDVALKEAKTLGCSYADIRFLEVLCRRGAYVQFDVIGKRHWMLDETRAALAARLVERGFGPQLLLGSDRARWRRPRVQHGHQLQPTLRRAGHTPGHLVVRVSQPGNDLVAPPDSK